MKKERQPNRAINNPPSSKPKPGPNSSPAEITELANPRCSSGKFKMMIFEYAGYATDSPMPSSNRKTNSTENA